MTYVTRFAPSPTGPLHLGHAYSAILAFDRAQAAAGRFLLRIEDIDRQRSKPEWEAQIYEDLAWLGLSWEEPVLRQSDRIDVYRAALLDLWRRKLLYPCTCSRRDIAAAAAAPHEGEPPMGPDGVIYPGTCRGRSRSVDFPQGVALRLDVRAALDALTPDHKTAEFVEHMTTNVGDIVLSRKDFLGSYHLSVVLDDAEQGVTEVVRGEDLSGATPIHRLLQHLFDLPVPNYHHHRLIRDSAGKRLAKRDDARSIATYRADGVTADGIRQLVSLHHG